MTIKSCLKSMRLRTLPLSEAGVILGTFIALDRGPVSWPAIFFLLTTTALLQIVSNLSNELGDTLNGTDTSDRQGIHYSIQDGEMTVEEMKYLIGAMVLACCGSGLLMVWHSFGTVFALEPILLLVLGAAAIWAAMHYTLGRNPYGYRGLGDIFVFIFFGLVSVCGGYYVCSHDLTDFIVLIPAAAIGCFSIAVLNVNNIRDMKTDAQTRTTVALKMGAKGARIYQTALIAAGWVLLCAYALLAGKGLLSWMFVITLPLFILHLKGVWQKEDRALDPMLPLLVVSTFATALLFGIGLLLA